MSITRWLDPAHSPPERPGWDQLSERARALHLGIDDHARRAGLPYLHPDSPTVQLDLFGSADVIAWQEGKAELLFTQDACWSQLPQLYARYGTSLGEALRKALAKLEKASAVLLTDSGMQATALLFDALLNRGGHAILMRQVYNKTRTYLEWLASRLGAAVSIVDDGDYPALEAAIQSNTCLVYAETFTNPRVRAQDLDALPALARKARTRAPGLKLVIDSTIATPWAFDRPLLELGVDVVVMSGTKALGGQDRDLFGVIATSDAGLGNAIMDLMAMRGGILDWRRAQAILEGLERAERDHERRCQTAAKIASYLAAHPRVSEVFHPSLPDHPDRAAIQAHYRRTGSLLSFRVKDADEAASRHFADVLAMSEVVRYALSFDGLTTKVNHHQTVSEYFTPKEVLERNGFDRLVRLAVGLEEPEDLMAALNWALHHHQSLGRAELESWRSARRRALGL